MPSASFLMPWARRAMPRDPFSMPSERLVMPWESQAMSLAAFAAGGERGKSACSCALAVRFRLRTRNLRWKSCTRQSRVGDCSMRRVGEQYRST
jgi:hypothetical protein